MQNNSDLQHKLRIRNDVFRFFKRVDCVADMYAGDMEITRSLWSNIADKVICLDKKKTSACPPENVDFHKADSTRSNWVALTESVCVVDCDAYGLVIDHVEAILVASTVDKIIFFTDGTPTKRKKVNCKDDVYERLKAMSKECRLELNDAGTTYYGWVYKCVTTSK